MVPGLSPERVAEVAWLALVVGELVPGTLVTVPPAQLASPLEVL